VTTGYFDRDNVLWLVEKPLSPTQHKTHAFKTKLLLASGGLFAVKGKKITHVDIDCALCCCHGVNGEDGAVAGVLQMAGIPSVESGVSASGVGIDKILTKYVAKGLGVPTLAALTIAGKVPFEEIASRIDAELGYPVIVKPATLGSSIGIKRADNAAELAEALTVAYSFDDRLLIEQALTDFYELNCSAMTVDGEVVASKIEQPLSQHEILTFADKYLAGDKGFSLKTQTAEATHIAEVQNLTRLLYTALDMSGVIRVDYIVDRLTDTVFLNEINTIPGSLAYGLWKERYTERQYGDVLVNEALARWKRKAAITYKFDSDVLEHLPRKK
jgi:D-alanine-D-alanine ligase